MEELAKRMRIAREIGYIQKGARHAHSSNQPLQRNFGEKRIAGCFVRTRLGVCHEDIRSDSRRECSQQMEIINK
jgi:hypothetical protein